MPIAIVIHKATAGIPARVRVLLHQACLLGYIGESPVAIVVIEDNASPVSHHQVVEAVIVVISDATPLPPAGSGEAGLRRDVGKRAVPVIVEQEIGRGMRCRDALEA